ncbi:MAG: hypothetical protein EOP06_10935, partial [Proteobacteria bacterium]
MKVLLDTRRIREHGRVPLGKQQLRHTASREGNQVVDLYWDAAMKRIILGPTVQDNDQVDTEKLASGRKE